MIYKKQVQRYHFNLLQDYKTILNILSTDYNSLSTCHG